MNRRGFTLLEAAVALVIVGTVSISALGVAAAESRAMRTATAAAPAVALARERMARLELTDAVRLARLPDSLAQGSWTVAETSYRWRATAQPVRDIADLWALRVEVEWSDGQYVLSSRSFRPAEATK
ncbi:MAG: prepilin-type N-terminal cleavage/methylation domain-containing protein [Gemmatimonadaceae bacterium]|nr:prepilin-type N-terminal cleavage/methylation domain-containing protein [Gemmatimonadaceae bacterium]